MPQISGPNSQENHLIEKYKEKGCAVSTQETAARRKWETEQLTRLSASWTDSNIDWRECTVVDAPAAWAHWN
jgi:hypothetical protein